VEAWDRKRIFKADDLRRLRRVYPRLKSISGHDVRPYNDLAEAEPDIRFYTMIREPLERCVAHYNFQVVTHGLRLSFEEWITDSRYPNRMTYHLSGTQDADAAIEVIRKRLFFVGLSSRYDESMLLLQKLSGDPKLRTDYPRYDPDGRGRLQRILFADPRYKHVPDDRVAREILSDPKRRAVVEAANQADLKLYSFVRSELFPEQIRAYGSSFAADLEAFRNRRERVLPSPRWMLNRLQRNTVYKPALWAYRRLRV
jgi:hypothetical protein